MPDIDLILPQPHPGQIEVLRSPSRFKVLMCGRRWGKSLISKFIAIKGKLKNHRIAYVVPEFSLAKEFFKELLTMLPKGLIKSSNKSDLTIELITGGYIRFFSGEAIESMRGLKFHTVIIDEAAFIADLESAWLKTVRPTLTDYRGNALFISTPHGRNYFYTLYLKGQNRENGYESFHYTSYDNPHIAASEIDEARAELPIEAFNQEYLAIAAANAGAVVAQALIEQYTIKNLSKLPPIGFGIDVAKYTDYTVITGLDAFGQTCYFDRFQKDNELTESKILALPQPVPKLMDATHGSLGDGIFESCIKQGAENLMPFLFTAVSKPKLITQMIQSIEKGQLGFNELTANELSIFEYKYGKSGHISYAAQIGGHDDAVISLALADKVRKMYPGDIANSIVAA